MVKEAIHERVRTVCFHLNKLEQGKLTCQKNQDSGYCSDPKMKRADKTKEGLRMQEWKNQTFIVFLSRML